METFNFKTTSRTILADLYTPVGVYLRLRDLYPQSVLMESSDYHEASNSRSFIGISPIASVVVGHGIATITYPDGSTKSHEVDGQYTTASAIHDLIDHIHVEGDDASVCALFGYTSFNAVSYFEHIDIKDETMEIRRTMPPTCAMCSTMSLSSSTTTRTCSRLSRSAMILSSTTCSE